MLGGSFLQLRQKYDHAKQFVDKNIITPGNVMAQMKQKKVNDAKRAKKSTQ